MGQHNPNDSGSQQPTNSLSYSKRSSKNYTIDKNTPNGVNLFNISDLNMGPDASNNNSDTSDQEPQQLIDVELGQNPNIIEADNFYSFNKVNHRGGADGDENTGGLAPGYGAEFQEAQDYMNI